jgi:hypothetical protein
MLKKQLRAASIARLLSQCVEKVAGNFLLRLVFFLGIQVFQSKIEDFFEGEGIAVYPGWHVQLAIPDEAKEKTYQNAIILGKRGGTLSTRISERVANW